jgi:putative ABC transport system permease protein
VDLPDSTYHTPLELQSFQQRTIGRLSALPGVLATGAVNYRPLGEFLMMGDFTLEGGRKLPRGYMADKPSASPGYFRAMGIRLLRGRDFTERDNADAPGVVIISHSVAQRLWPNEDPIGTRISMDDHPKPEDWLTIVGVVDDVRQQGLTKKPDPAVYRPYLQVKYPFFLQHVTFVLRTTSDPVSLAPAMRAAFHEVDKDQPAQSIATMQELVAATTAEPRFQARLLGAFSLLALVLATLGIYGVLAYSVAQRTREIGIRMALGAETGDVIGMVLRRTAALAGAGILLGAGGALALTRVLARFLFEVKPTDPATFLTVAFGLAAVAMAAGFIPARRATRIDPAVSLRYE